MYNDFKLVIPTRNESNCCSKLIVCLGLFIRSFFSFFFHNFSLSHHTYVLRLCFHTLQSDSTVTQLYDATWYMLAPPLRKRFLTLMLVTQSHIQLKAFNMYAINMGLYSKTLRIVFSFVNGIMLMQKKIK